LLPQRNWRLVLPAEASRILGVIPARGGSKRLPRKNVLPLVGKPMIGYSIEAAKSACLLTRAIVSTDDEEIAAISRSLGADVPFLRPRELSGDKASSVDVLLHALDFCEAQDSAPYDIAVLLQPTSPLRGPTEIDDAIRLVRDDPAMPAAITVMPVGGHHPNYVYRRQADGRFQPFQGPQVLGTRMQDFEPLYIRTGSVYVTRVSYLRAERRIMAPDTAALVVGHEFYVNVDDPKEFALAEYVLSRRSGT
jgi:CMP-N-acetylneuraminic acid synthetase